MLKDNFGDVYCLAVAMTLDLLLVSRSMAVCVVLCPCEMLMQHNVTYSETRECSLQSEYRTLDLVSGLLQVVIFMLSRNC